MNKIICPNCGAAISEKEAECPFCGYINMTGAEEKFMQDIQQTEEELSQIPEIQKSEYKKSISKNAKIIMITMGIAVFVAVILFGIHMLFDKVIYSYEEPDYKAEMLWEKENYPILDKLYEEDDLAGIKEFEIQMYEKNETDKTMHSLDNWEHYGFYRMYCNYLDFMSYSTLLDNGEELLNFEIENIMYLGMFFYKERYTEIYEEFSDEELTEAEDYRDEVLDIMFDRFSFSEQELDKLYEKASKKGYEEYEVYYDYGKKNKNRFQ